MKKGKITLVVMIAISCFALSLIMCMQFKIVQQTDITLIETMREEELKSELANLKQLYKEAEEQYQEKITKLNEYREKQESGEESEKLIAKELQETIMYLGKTDVQGEGIEIVINDIEEQINEDEYINPISAEDLLIIVDYLKLAGAEAISINGERIINTTDIVDIYNIIFVNQQRILAPYTIKAIGNSASLESTLLGNGGYIEELKNIGFDAYILRSNNITIPKYSKEIKQNYIQ